MGGQGGQGGGGPGFFTGKGWGRVGRVEGDLLVRDGGGWGGGGGGGGDQGSLLVRDGVEGDQ